MVETFFITGATGNVGEVVIKHLLYHGQKVIATKRKNKKVENKENLYYKYFDFTDSTTWSSCLEGVTKVFLMRPPHISKIKRDINPFIEYLKEKRIKQVVFLSVQGVENNKIIPHFKVEESIRELKIPYTFIRPSFFMQNLTTTHLSEIQNEGIIFVPAGEGKTNFIDVRDIGEIIAKTFLSQNYLNKAYTITGEKSYSYQEVAESLSLGLDTKIKYINPNPLSFVIGSLKRGRKLTMTLVMLALYSVVKSGKGDITTTVSQDILERKPISLQEFIKDHKLLLSKN